MTALLRRAAAGSRWLLLALAVLAHAGLAVLAVTEYAALGWLFGTGLDLAMVTLVLASALAGLAACGCVAARAAGGSARLRRLVSSARRPVPAAVGDAAAGLGLTGRVDAVHASEAFAVTYGLARPRILVSDGLAAALDRSELAAVLAHERCHLRRRDPLRLLAARLLAAYACYLPAAGLLAERAALRWELAADRAAAASAGRGVLAAALLRLATLPLSPAPAAASPAGDAEESLKARVAQLEHGSSPRPRLAPGRILASAGCLALLAAAGTCCVGLSQALPGGVL